MLPFDSYRFRRPRSRVRETDMVTKGEECARRSAYSPISSKSKLSQCRCLCANLS